MEDRQELVTCRLRDHVVEVIAQTFLSTPFQLNDRRVKRVVAYSRRLEGELYEKANSQLEYYQFLVEKMYEIQIELQPNRQLQLSKEKEWHELLTNDFRDFVVQTIVEDIFPNTNSRYERFAEDPRMGRLQMYARKVEADIYKVAGSWEEYSNALDAKIYKIQKELDIKRQRRLQNYNLQMEE